jgi:hypothetical protein
MDHRPYIARTAMYVIPGSTSHAVLLAVTVLVGLADLGLATVLVRRPALFSRFRIAVVCVCGVTVVLALANLILFG